VVSLGTPVSSTNNTDNHDITEIVLKVTLITISHTFFGDMRNGNNIYFPKKGLTLAHIG
jgi:hypothetical protein